VSSVKNVSGTAFVVAEFRADENRQPTPLYQDPVVALFLDEDSREAAARMAERFPPVKAMVKTRTKYLDDMLDSQLREGCRQVVVLGAGLDTRAVRKASPGVAYFEIDDPATLELKRRCYERAGIDVNVTFIAGNYVTDGLVDLLAQNGFDFDLPTYFIWEGNTMYLPLASVKHTIAEIRRTMKRFRLSCDYMAEAVISKTTGDAGVTTLVESFEAMAAPWLSGIGDIESLARELNVTVIDDVTTGALHERYWPGDAVTSPIFRYYSVCTVES
jgi:methyltransferase (TIGR00027 family)